MLLKCAQKVPRCGQSLDGEKWTGYCQLCMTDFIHFEDRDSDHPFVAKVWRCRSDRADRFLSVAATTFEIVVTRLQGKTFLTLRGPETQARPLDCPGDGEWLAIRFKPGTFIPRFLPQQLRDWNDVTLPDASEQAFWLNGSAMEYPDFENAESFVNRLVKSESMQRDPVVRDLLEERPLDLTARTAQRHFLRATGITYATFIQIERARYATQLVRSGRSVLDVVESAGYFDQAHLTRSLRRFIGETPQNIRLRERQLSFLYKTEQARNDWVFSKT